MEAILTMYNLLALILFTFWCALFFLRAELRAEMLILGVFSIFLLPLIFALNQFQRPEVTEVLHLNAFDLLFSFCIAGIAGVLYHTLLGKHYHNLPRWNRKRRKQDESAVQYWILRLFIAFLVFIWGAILLNLLFDISLPFAALISSIFISVYIVSHRHDLLSDAIWSGFLTAFIVYLSAAFLITVTDVDFSIAPISSDASILGVPVDLLAWAAAIGLAFGPLYEYVRTLELK